MALDGIFLNYLKYEIEQKCINAKVDKVNQPSKEELVLIMRTREGSFKLMLSCRANSPRIHLTDYAPENPQNPPMLCMLLRKKLCGATLCGIRQEGLDRVLFLDFDSHNEIGDKIKLTLCIEIMSKYSNIILIDSQGNIIDSLKRVDSTKSSVREILPSVKYILPPSQNKLDILTADVEKIAEAILSDSNKTLSSAILKAIEGVSPIVCRELAFKSVGDDKYVSELDGEDINNLKITLERFINKVKNHEGVATVAFNSESKPQDFSFLDITQYGNAVKLKHYETFSSLLDDFYYERDRIERTKQKAQDLFKLLHSSIERTSRKINIQQAELKECDNRETLRIYAELITANQYQLPKGVEYYEVENYYDDNKIIKVPCDVALSPTKNAQKYYKEYKKAFTAEKMLKEMIEQGKAELEYFDAVLDCLTRAETEAELNEIRDELVTGGYLKKKVQSGKMKKSKSLEPMKFLAKDGTIILVGRNNIQNDKLSLKQAQKSDMWLHTKNIPGSHVIISAQGEEIADDTIQQAAELAAYYSSARNSSKVGVDYTLVKNLKKPNGAKPGMVVYETNYTIYVDPKDYKRI
ncbi:MAG: NFACT family protein [Clostridiales bacterium]|nr:NFACT family protein [Clostridiales bacterium]